MKVGTHKFLSKVMKKNIGLLLFLLTSCVYTIKHEDGFYHYSYCTAIAGEKSEYHLFKSPQNNEVDSIDLIIKMIEKKLKNILILLHLLNTV
ncbi:hypothetical protein NH26_03165 [Flammeovirga pacifica]|uniref:Lipoprotein n=1 Tax=Flammeovirga pacifica TaxID=915059 RepID=A0A1S1YWL6_FLAPC|nr:hypothetical protein NH26_03165 [Flammeovirga pacifica]